MVEFVFGALGLLLLAGFGWLAVGVARAARLHRTATQRLAAMGCPRCGGAIGVDAAGVARADWLVRVHRAHAQARENERILRIDPCWRFPCPACEAPLVFDPSGTELLVAEPT